MAYQALAQLNVQVMVREEGRMRRGMCADEWEKKKKVLVERRVRERWEEEEYPPISLPLPLIFLLHRTVKRSNYGGFGHLARDKVL